MSNDKSEHPLRAWRRRMGAKAGKPKLTLAEAAPLIGMSARGLGDLERGISHAEAVPLLHRLAAAAVEAGIPPIPDSSSGDRE